LEIVQVFRFWDHHGDSSWFAGLNGMGLLGIGLGNSVGKGQLSIALLPYMHTALGALAINDVMRLTSMALMRPEQPS